MPLTDSKTSIRNITSNKGRENAPLCRSLRLAGRLCELLTDEHQIQVFATFPDYFESTAALTYPFKLATNPDFFFAVPYTVAVEVVRAAIIVRERFGEYAL